MAAGKLGKAGSVGAEVSSLDVELSEAATAGRTLLTVSAADRSVDLEAGPPPEPVTPILDDFDRTGGGAPLGPDWTTFPAQIGLLAPRIGVNNLVSASGGASAAALWHEEFSADQEVYATTDSDEGYIILLLRQDGADDGGRSNGYSATFSEADGLKIYRFDAGTPAQVGSTVEGLRWTRGDQWSMRCIGDRIEVRQRPSGGEWPATPAIAATDATYGHAGFIGLGTETSASALDDFGGGAVVGWEVEATQQGGRDSDLVTLALAARTATADAGDRCRWTIVAEDDSMCAAIVELDDFAAAVDIATAGSAITTAGRSLDFGPLRAAADGIAVAVLAVSDVDTWDASGEAGPLASWSDGFVELAGSYTFGGDDEVTEDVGLSIATKAVRSGETVTTTATQADAGGSASMAAGILAVITAASSPAAILRVWNGAGYDEHHLHVVDDRGVLIPLARLEVVGG